MDLRKYTDLDTNLERQIARLQQFLLDIPVIIFENISRVYPEFVTLVKKFSYEKKKRTSCEYVDLRKRWLIIERCWAKFTILFAGKQRKSFKAYNVK